MMWPTISPNWKGIKFTARKNFSACIVKVGPEKAAETFYSTCHGAGRVKSRTAATKAFDANKIISELKAKGIYVMASSRGTIVEEAPLAYKDINQVVDVVEGAGISKKVCRMRPIGVVKG